eukprot:gene6826-7043_t
MNRKGLELCVSPQTATLTDIVFSSTAEGGRFVEEGGKKYYINPAQPNTTCNDVAPDDRYSCEDQKKFGACDARWLVRGNYCGLTCSRCVGGGPVVTAGGRTYYANPAQKGDTCNDVPPDVRHTCKNQRDFGKCSATFITNSSEARPATPAPAATAGSTTSAATTPPAPPREEQGTPLATEAAAGSNNVNTSAVSANAPAGAEGGRFVEEDGKKYYINPAQPNTTCNDVAPDDRYSCEDQKKFGACDARWLIRSNYCGLTCSRCVGGGRVVTAGGRTYYANPAQKGDTCNDVPPDVRHTCKNQRDFGKCSDIFMRNGRFLILFYAAHCCPMQFLSQDLWQIPLPSSACQ